MKTSKLTGHALDWAVAKCDFGGHEEWDGTLRGVDCVSDMQGGVFSPSVNWEQGGTIIEREGVELAMHADQWRAVMHLEGGSIYVDGPTLLIAAMRCYVASQLGDEVEISEELQP